MVGLRLPATLGAARLARGAIDDVPELAPYDDLRFVVGLLATELVANSVRHAGLDPDDEVELLVESLDSAVHIEVSDSGAGFFPLLHTRSRPGKRVEHGLHLIDVLADRWGYRCGSPGCCLWFDLDLVPGRRTWHGREPIPQR
jgi:anti-sigma regulatory factor (Ser/Thr protein kinase)